MSTYLLNWTGDAQDVDVMRFATKSEAAEFELATGRSGFEIQTIEDMANPVLLNRALITKLYNALAAHPVNKFESRDIAVARFFKLLTTSYHDIPLTQKDQKMDDETDTEVAEVTEVTEVTEVAKVPKAKKEKKVVSATTGKTPGVIDTIVHILNHGGGTVTQMHEKLQKAFPERAAEGMLTTLRVQLVALPKNGRVQVTKEKVDGHVHYKAAA